MYKVIIIDDEPIIVEGLQKIIPWEKWNCNVEAVAYNGVDGLELISRVKPDIIISDISMPQMDGLSMIASVKSQFPNLEIIILTGYRNFDYARQAINLGVTRFLLKPSKMDEIEEALTFITNQLGEKKEETSALPNDEENEQDQEQEEHTEENPAGKFIVKNAVRYIEEHYQEKLKLSDVADQVYVSQWHLSKLLNRHTQQNFSEILNNVRIEKARELLKDPALRIGDIAEEVGFLDIAHFSRVFKKQVGKSANDYRNTVLCKK
ncbi:response regulator transcription factor [Anaerosporobacter sp.]|uniref:response regulator transcription factor n=1 Tax=Anaerosporobacter sp. TaxID=1872529 RepID=UPI00286F4918|nr:response regulator [Anaerosporobacter sp.]